jgi:hypothetical protein
MPYDPLNEAICIRKLRSALSEPLRDEYRVLYVMAQTRKALELERKPYRPGCLYIYCCWPLHVKLSGEGASKVMEVFDVPEAVGDFRQQQEPNSRLNELVSFSALRRDFKMFLLEYSLPIDVVDDDQLWHDFLLTYCGLVAESPLSYTPNPPFKHIRRIEVRLYSDDWLQSTAQFEPSDRSPAAVSWRITPRVGEPYERAKVYPELSEEDERYFWTGE